MPEAIAKIQDMRGKTIEVGGIGFKIPEDIPTSKAEVAKLTVMAAQIEQAIAPHVVEVKTGEAIMRALWEDCKGFGRAELAEKGDPQTRIPHNA